ncbi:MAG: right-handed parallel beta-helix repeat-containing protein [Phycisphaerae bacterium]|nr:right-handed parallel beta-helix repeat-containing protein [Phycisphaerae bacterium]
MRASSLLNAIVLALAVHAAEAAHAQVLFVDGSARPGGDGASWASAISDLDDALGRARGGAASEVWVREGLYVPRRDDGRDPRTARFDVAGGLTVYGGFRGDERSPAERDAARHPTVLSGDLRGNDEIDGDRSDNAYRVVEASSGEVVLDGLTIRAGQADGLALAEREGAAVGGAAGSIRLVACRLEANEATDGGAALAARGARVALRACLVRANRAPLGAVALAPDADDEIDIEDCTFAANHGTALAVRGADREGQLLVRGCTFTANDAAGGSTVAIEESHATVSSCLFVANVGGDGAALRVTSSVALVRDSTFLEHASSGDGGAILVASSSERATRIERCAFVANSATNGAGAAVDGAASVTIVDCTFAANEAAEAGGAVASGAPDLAGAPGPALRLERCVLRGNRATAAGGALFVKRHALEIADCLVVGNEAPSGAAVRSAFTSALIVRSTIAGNRAAASRARGGAAIGAGVVKSEGPLTLVDCVLWANEAAGVDAFAAQVLLTPPDGAPASLVVLRSCVEGLPPEFEAAGGISADPVFLDLDGEDDVAGTADDDLALAASSPCINRGDPTLRGTDGADALGAPRVRACRVDLGGLESALQPADEPDCDGDGTPDACAIADGAGDCDGNGAPDACEISAGAPDCDANGVPDACELAFGSFAATSAVSTPFGAGAPLAFTVRDPGPAQSDVTFTLKARGDFGGPGQAVDITVNGVPVGAIFGKGSHCAHEPEVRTYAIPKGDWNAATDGGDITVAFMPSATVDPSACVQSLAQATVAFSLLPVADANSNGLVDACEPRADLDGDGAVGATDVATLLAAWGPCDGCNADLDRSGAVGAEDLALLLAAWTEA